MESFSLTVNGKTHTINSSPQAPLLYVLRNQLQLNGPKYGCGFEQCGACMVHIDGKCGPSCQIPIKEVNGKTITTIEGLAKDNELHPVQQAFIDEQAAQCGYCINGLVMNSVALLNENQNPSEETIKERLQRNICRCGVHSRVVKAVQKASSSQR
ncbi:MAG: (2Fe-2S)-binding protein [Flavobacteriaceae bacterium]|nr:(2Fe-2S)-binding protein [Flavobacteriaceae bacterium]